MKSVMLAAVVVQLTAAGGAGAGNQARGRQAAERNGASQAPSIKESFSALKKEVDSVKHDYAEARERERREAERKKREAETPYVAPPKRAP